jgi:ElaB/YqjD/DUF883 family membrane-anchored ribosome-binding protein
MADKTASRDKITTRNGKSDQDDISAQIDQLRADIGNLADAIGRRGARKVGGYQSSARGYADDLVGTTRAALEATRSELTAAEGRARRHVARRPFETIGLAIGIGLAAGFLLRR